MRLIDEIHNQKPSVRYALFGLSVFVVLSTVGFLWIVGLQRDVFMALHDDPSERAAFVARQSASLPKPIAVVARGVGSVTAAIGGLVGIDSGKGFDRDGSGAHTPGVVHLLPLSN
jgi:hypothetical protein